MNATSDTTRLRDSLDRLALRVRWKRWLGRLHRFVWACAAALLLIYVADLTIGLRVWSLRVASGAVLAGAAVILILDLAKAWLGRLELVGLAHLLEKRYPDLAERLVTLVQIPPDEASSGLGRLLRAELQPMLAEIEPGAACSLQPERRRWFWTIGIMAIVFGSLIVVPTFGPFMHRFATAWVTPLVPFSIDLGEAKMYALRGGSVTIEARIAMLDVHAEPPAECDLLCEDDAGHVTVTKMTRASTGHFAASIENVRVNLACRVKSGDVESVAVAVNLIDAPSYKSKPSLTVTPPSYVKVIAGSCPLGEVTDRKIEVLQYSKLRITLPLDRPPVRAWLHIKAPGNGAESNRDQVAVVALKSGAEGGLELADEAAAAVGEHHARLVLELEHGLSATLPVGQWTVYEDYAPRFTQSLRLHGAALSSNHEQRVSPDDALKLQTTIEDDEGLGAIEFEYRINEGAPRIERWLHGAGKTRLAINDWLPLPSTLKEGDRLNFRIRAADNRRLKQGEVRQTPSLLPPGDLTPNVTVAPSASGGAASWITLRVDRSVEEFLKQQAKAQSDEVREVIGKIKRKVQAESEQVKQLKQTVHQQTALTLAQAKQAEKLRALNREIAMDLLEAGERFGANPELAALAEHFLGIAENEMMKSAEALQRFGDKDRPLADAEKELTTTQEALQQASKKLDRMLDWNTLVAQERLDRFQLEKLAKRQNDLAERLDKLLADQPPSDAELAKQIEAVKAEQAKLADQAMQAQEQNRLVQDSLQAMEQQRADKLARDAEQLAAEQRAMREAAPDKLSPEIKARLDDLAKRQADLAKRVEPFAHKNDGPDVKPAQAAADSLRKPNIDQAVLQQREHEKRLQEWLAKLPLGGAGSLRDQVLQLIQRQKTIQTDLVRLGGEISTLNPMAVKQRLADLTTRQKEMPIAIAKLPIDAKDQHAVRQRAEQAARQAADQLAVKDALSAFDSMDKTVQALEALAALLPKTPNPGPKEVKDAALRAKLDQVEGFAREQQKLREDTERLRADAAKASAGGGKSPLGEKLDKLASELAELSQKAGPEMKAMAKESAQALDAAKKAMEAAQQMKAQGNADEAKKMDDTAENQMQLAVKQLKQAQDQAKAMPKDATKTAEALKEGMTQMRKAEKNLPAMPKDAQTAMKMAAKSLEQASQAGRQATRQVPQPSRNPSARAMLTGGGGPGSKLGDFKLDPSQAKAWGQLPGELKTRMLQDLRARFGAEYADTVRQYFDSLAESPK